MIIGERIYVSTDTETDGPIPGSHSMLSLGSAVYSAEGTLQDQFEVNLASLPDATRNPKLVAWWAENPDLWSRARANSQDPEVTMKRYETCLGGLSGRPIFVGFPLTFDFVYWHLIRFTGRNPLVDYASDIKGYDLASC